MNPSYQPVRLPTTSTHRIRAIDYHVTEWGPTDGERLFYLHGWGDTGSSFQFVVDALPDDWRIIAPDWRGFGRSGRNSTSYWFPDYLADLDELLAIYQPDEPVRLVGHSMGSNVAALYAGTFPERVAAMVNVDGFGLPDADPDEAPERYRRWVEQSRAPQPFRDFADAGQLARHIRRSSPAMTEEQARFVAACWAETTDTLSLLADPRHKLPNPTLYRRAEAQACWARISVPVLQVVGGKSRFADYVDEFTGALKGLGVEHGETVVVHEAGHMVHFEAPQALADAIDGFLRL
ncbi:MAG: alpha/beta hydrolase [Pseudomonadota bacterium]